MSEGYGEGLTAIEFYMREIPDGDIKQVLKHLLEETERLSKEVSKLKEELGRNSFADDINRPLI